VSEIAVRRAGEGPRVVLIHGGLSPEPTWSAQEELAERWELVLPVRRGFDSSPATDWIDFEADAADIEPLLGGGAHVAAFSYGGPVATLLAERHPERVASLALIEPSLFAAAEGHPDLDAMLILAQRYIAGAATAEEQRDFRRISGVPESGEDAAAARAVVEGQIGKIRNPAEARPDLGAIADAGVPVMVVSGGHNAGIEAVCDAVAEQARAERVVYEGAGHAAHKAPGFNERFESFLAAAAQAGRNAA
jgi:pimeloyl-ACP methyl ester carboxylesterase